MSKLTPQNRYREPDGFKPGLSREVFNDPHFPKSLNFRVPAQFHQAFKLYATQNGMSMVDLLQKSFNALRQQRR